jgi:hypothetical protein
MLELSTGREYHTEDFGRVENHEFFDATVSCESDESSTGGVDLLAETAGTNEAVLKNHFVVGVDGSQAEGAEGDIGASRSGVIGFC